MFLGFMPPNEAKSPQSAWTEQASAARTPRVFRAEAAIVVVVQVRRRDEKVQI